MSLSLSDRQKTMLTHMGIRLDFLPVDLAPDHAESAAPQRPALHIESGITRESPADPASPMVNHTPGQTTPRVQSVRVAQARTGPDESLARPAPVQRHDIAQLDWTQLQQAVRECTACGLCQTRKQTVFGVGAPPMTDAPVDVMIVGEAPGENEDLQGEPFVGAAGQLLDQMLTALGLSRQPEGGPSGRVFIANVLKCRPPGNRNPHADEVERCLPFLQRQIELARPKLLLAMGRFGAQALLAPSQPHIEGTPLGKLRGQAYAYQGIPLVVTYHPAYLLRSPSEKGKVWADLCLAQSLANGA
jgi:uracil-DNA glycosylase family 4